MPGFFSNFPTVTYNGQTVTDITKSVSLFPSSLENSVAFQPLTLNQSLRSDQLAKNLYNDPYLEWIIFLTNQEIDPINGWYMDQNQFNDFLNTKYGDYIGIAQQRVMYYTNNWYNGDVLTPGGFSALPPHLTKYYQPVSDYQNNIIQYVRTQDNWTVTTNHLMNMTFSNTVANVGNFILDEIITMQWDNGQVGSGQVAFCSNNQLSYQHVSGFYYPAANNLTNVNAAAFYVAGANSGVTLTITNTNQITSFFGYDTLQSDEDVFYDPVTYYDYENNKNELKKTIKILDPSYTPQITAALNKVFK